MNRLKIFTVFIMVACQAFAEEDVSKYLPFDMPSHADFAKSKKKVFAHWHHFPLSFDGKYLQEDHYEKNVLAIKSVWKPKARHRPLPRENPGGENWKVLDIVEEIRRAQDMGCDGFMMNHFGEENKNIDPMLEAARRVNSDFRILLAADCSYSRRPGANVIKRYSELYTKYGNHPFAFRLDDRVVISGFGAAWIKPVEWKTIFENLKKRGVDAVFFPYAQTWSPLLEKEYLDLSIGVGGWGSRFYGDHLNFQGVAKKCHDLGRLWMMPVSPQLVRVKNYYFKEAQGSDLLRSEWMTAIEEGADWVQLVTWNDYGEGTEVAPSTGTQYAIADLCSYYSTWFKTGKEPRIVRDVLYYFHRTQFWNVKPTQDEKFEARGGPKPVDMIELLAFLKEPGMIEIEIGGKISKKEAGYGITSFKVPLNYGTPEFRLIRNSKTEISYKSAFSVLSKKVKANDPLYRAGSSSREVVAMADGYKRYFEE